MMLHGHYATDLAHVTTLSLSLPVFLHSSARVLAGLASTAVAAVQLVVSLPVLQVLGRQQLT